MANKKISQLTRLTSQSLSTEDLLLVVDVDAPSTPTGETKATTIDQYYGFLRSQGLMESCSYALTASHALSSDLAGSSIYTDITLAVTSSGNDSTGDETWPFKTLTGAFTWLQSRRIIHGGSVTVALGNEEYIHTSEVDLHHPDGQLISVKGNNGSDLIAHANATIDSLNFVGEGNVTASITTTSQLSNAAAVGDYLLITDMGTNTIGAGGQASQERALCGAWRILSKGSGTVSVGMTLRHNSAVTYGINAAEVYLLQTKLTFEKSSGLSITNGCIRSIENMAILGVNQTTFIGDGGDGISVGRLNNRFHEADATADLVKYRRGAASTTTKRVGVSGFAYAGFAARDGSMSCISCCSSNNAYGFYSTRGNPIDAPHCVATGNSFAGFMAIHAGIIEARWANASFNKESGIYADQGSYIVADSRNNSTKCTYVGYNGNGQIVATERSNVYAKGARIREHITPPVAFPNPAAAVVARNHSVVNINYSYCSPVISLLTSENNSSVTAESIIASVMSFAVYTRGSSVTLGNAWLLRNNTSSNQSPMVFLDLGATLYCSGLKIEKRQLAGANDHNVPVINVNQSTIVGYGYYMFQQNEVHPSVVEQPLNSINILNQFDGPAIRCENNSSAVIQQITSSVKAGENDLESTYKSLIRVAQTPATELTYYPTSDVPFDSNLAMIRFNNA